MPFREAVAFALASLRASKLRAFLTVLGITIGVAAVIAIVAITGGLDSYISNQVLELGSNSFSVQKFPAVITSHQQYMEMRKRKDITMADYRAVRAGCDDCRLVGAQLGTSRTVKFRDIEQDDVRITGMTANIPRIGTVRDIVAGRPLVEDDVERAQPVAVIGADLVDAFFKQMEPIGKTLMISGQPVKVIGVGERKGSIFGFSQDNFVWMPITAFRKMFSGNRSITISVEAASMASLETAQDECRIIMRNRRHLGFSKPDDFSVETGESVMDLWKMATRNIYVVTIVVTAISLLVGGVVVMNIMLVSVAERIREIGVRKALGARRVDILRQFLVEAVMLSFLGGALGVIGAAIFSWVLATILGHIMSSSISAPVRFWAVLAALGMSTCVGLAAGIYPASRAAALEPVEALRNE